MNSIVLVATRSAEESAGLWDRIFGLDPQLIADTLILALAVFVLFLALSYLLFNPAREFLKKRREFVANELAQATQDKEDAYALKLDYDDKLKQVDKEAQELLSAARKKAMKRENEIVNEAKEEAGRILARANKEVELEKSKIQNEVKQEMVAVASAMAGKFVAASLDEKKQNDLIEEALKEMGDQTWQSQ